MSRLFDPNDHGPEGIALLTAEPSRLMCTLIWLLMAALIAGLAWSFIGKSEEIVSASGRLGPEAQTRAVFAPVAGELVDVFMREGMPVRAGDVLARIDSPSAVEAATRALDADIRLQQAEEAARLLPARQRVLEGEITALSARIDALEQAYQKQQAEGLARLADEQKLKLDRARLQLDDAAKALSFAEKDWQKFQRLSRSAGGGGIPRVQVEEKRRVYEAAQAAYELARTELGQFEVALNRDYQTRRDTLQQKSEELLALYAEREAKKVQVATQQSESDAALRAARAQAAGAARITFDDIDENSYLLIKAPVAGVLTNVGLLQPGAPVDGQKPLADIAPRDARTVLHIDIPERERAFLREGMAVKLKFNAFPFQRHGFIQGTLDYIAPDAVALSDGTAAVPVYRGRVSLDRLDFTVEGRAVPLRYGMVALVEIVVRQRRLIDFVLDPFRQLAG